MAEKEFRTDLQWETIRGQVPSKANLYLAVPDSAGGRRIIKDERVRDYERSFAQQCQIYKDRHISRPFNLHAVVYESTWSYDIDNSLKTVLDCMQYVGAISNDNLCISISARKVIDPNNPRVMYAIEETEPRLFSGP